MKLYHYTTWQGIQACVAGALEPSNDCNKHLPKLVWLTSNEHWESCIQATDTHDQYTRGPSDPEEYTSRGIPCWKFEVEVPHRYRLHYQAKHWIHILEEGKGLGSDVSEWHWISKRVPIVKSYKWIGNKWEEAYGHNTKV